jgi:hypothetical protein
MASGHVYQQARRVKAISLGGGTKQLINIAPAVAPGSG